ncbi:hypothetical protein LCGC14_0847660 [marine sediment metagenome]|uniref:Uncharacterized protein n=1 Tax=marine sediment metagenome TaxID=412755 RepID=A0A0F9SIC5_9ZZZZ
MTTHSEPTRSVIGRSPLEIGGAQAVSKLPHGYEGACRVFLDNPDEHTIAVVPSPAESFRIARYAIGPDGHSTGVCIVPAPHSDITHQTFLDWL